MTPKAPVAAEAFLARAHADPLVWAKFFIPQTVPLPYSDAHHAWMRLATTCPRLALAAPRDHAKSTTFCVVLPLWLALEHPGESLVIVAASEDLAATWMRRIKVELEGNPLVKWRYGKQETPKWTEIYLELKNGTTIRGIGAEATIRGRRPSRIIGDDLENDEMVRSEMRRLHFEDWFWSAFVNTLEPEGRLCLTGTILHIRSFLAKLLTTPPPGWTTRRDCALSETGAPLWPAKWPVAALTRRKAEIGTLQFEQEYQNNPMPDDVAIFKEPWFQPYEGLPIPEADLQVFGGLDIGVRAQEQHDPSAFVVYGVVPYGPDEGKVYLLDAARGRWTIYELLDELFLRQARWPACRWGIEAVQFQYALSAVLQAEAWRRGYGSVGVDPWPVKQDKVTRAKEATIPFEAGRVFVRPSQRAFVDELLVFPQGDTDDWVDANSMAWLSIHRFFRTSTPPTVVTTDPVASTIDVRAFRPQMAEYARLTAQYPTADPADRWLAATLRTG